jgi:hypothetical protein
MRPHGILIAYYLFNEDLNHAVDLEVIKTKAEAPSETTQTREGFRVKLLERDACCAWTGGIPNAGVGMHIIPYKRGSEVRVTLCEELI